MRRHRRTDLRNRSPMQTTTATPSRHARTAAHHGGGSGAREDRARRPSRRRRLPFLHPDYPAPRRSTISLVLGGVTLWRSPRRLDDRKRRRYTRRGLIVVAAARRRQLRPLPHRLRLCRPARASDRRGEGESDGNEQPSSVRGGDKLEHPRRDRLPEERRGRTSIPGRGVARDLAAARSSPTSPLKIEQPLFVIWAPTAATSST